MKSRKGISPLIATVLLIAFTMAIAGMMATWATSFVSTKMAETSNQTDITCSGNFNVDARVIGNETIYAIVDVSSSNTALTNWKAYLYYDSPSNNGVANNLSNSNMSLRTGDTWTFVSSGNNVSVIPRYLKISAGNCPIATKTVPIIETLTG